MEALIVAIGQAAGIGAGGGGGFYALKWLLDFKSRREDKREEMIDRGTEVLIKSLTDQIKALADRVSVLERLLRECQSQHAITEMKLARLEGANVGLGEARHIAATILSEERAKDN